jgi:hypothetical protein
VPPPNLVPMQGTDLDRLEKVAEVLALVFYVLIFTALIMTLAGSTGSGFALLVVSACAHVGRASLEEFVAAHRAGSYRSRPEPRAKAEPATARTRSARRTAA